MLVDASGGQYWPAFGVRGLMKIADIRQLQLAQVALDTVEARLVVDTDLTPEKERELIEHFKSRLPYGFAVTLKYLPEIPRGAGGKFEDFVCEISKPTASRTSLT